MSNYNLTRFKVYFKSLKHTTMTQEAKTKFVNLISNIGGTFGLLI